jgi:hypothetical protein
MENFLAFKYTTIFSRKLDGAGINDGVEIGFEIVERVRTRIIAKDFTPIRNIIGRSLPTSGKDSIENYMKSVRCIRGHLLINRVE